MFLQITYHKVTMHRLVTVMYSFYLITSNIGLYVTSSTECPAAINVGYMKVEQFSQWRV